MWFAKSLLFLSQVFRFCDTSWHLLSCCVPIAVSLSLSISGWAAGRAGEAPKESGWKLQWMEKKLGSFVPKCWPLDHISILVRILRRAFSWFLQFAVVSTNSRRLLRVLFFLPQSQHGRRKHWRWFRVSSTLGDCTSWTHHQLQHLEEARKAQKGINGQQFIVLVHECLFF